MSENGCHVIAFDCTKNVDKQEEFMQKYGVAFHPWCIGRPDEAELLRNTIYTKELEPERSYDFYPLRTTMQMLGHSHVDVLKLDVGGFEWEALADLLTQPDAMLPRVLLFTLYLEESLALYVPPATVVGRRRDEVRRLFRALWGRGYRTVSKTENPYTPLNAEFVLVR